MSQFRLVILDNVKDQLENPTAQSLLSSMIFEKQKNFLRTDPNYVVMDKHDMIGTHYLIFDVTNFLSPKLVFAIRTTFADRASQHSVETPLMQLRPHIGDEGREYLKDFMTKHDQKFVDCNAWFVDVEYSKKNSGLDLANIGYMMVVLNLLRCGYTGMIGCTNEKYNASRWVKGMGDTPDHLFFEHPTVKSTHKLMMMEKFHFSHFVPTFEKYEDLVKNMFEVFPVDAALSMPSFYEYASSIFTNKFNLVKDAA